MDERTPEQKRQDQLGLRQAVDRLMEHMHQKGRLRERKGRLLTQLLSEHTSTPSPGASATSGNSAPSSGQTHIHQHLWRSTEEMVRALMANHPGLTEEEARRDLELWGH